VLSELQSCFRKSKAHSVVICSKNSASFTFNPNYAVNNIKFSIKSLQLDDDIMIES